MDTATALKNPLDSQLSFSSSVTRNLQEIEPDPTAQSPNSLLSSKSVSRSLDLRDPYLPEDDGTILTPEHAFIQYQTRSEDQTCQICGQPAVGFHHRAYVCEACKKFFMRHTAARFRNRDEAGGIAAESVCPMGGQCRVEGPGRGKCPHCRYRKCLDLGMTLTPPGGEGGCDISQIPCRVCGGPSSGFHFGALTCEGCKGFFRRTVLSNVRLECLSNNDCPITPVNRNMCKSCRFQRCLAVGMSKTGSRIGRQPNAIKYYCAREISQLSTTTTSGTGTASNTGSNSDSESPAACPGTARASSRNSSGNRSGGGGVGAGTPANGGGSLPRQSDDVGGHRSPMPPSASQHPSCYAHLTPMYTPAVPEQPHQYNGRGAAATPVNGRRASSAASSASSGFSPLPASLPPPLPLSGSPFEHNNNGTASSSGKVKKRRSLSDRSLLPQQPASLPPPPPPPSYFDTNGSGSQQQVVHQHLVGEMPQQQQQPTPTPEQHQQHHHRLKYASTSSTCSSASSSPSCSRGDFVLGRHPTPPSGTPLHQQHHRPWYTGPPVSHHTDAGSSSLVMLPGHVTTGARDTSSDYQRSGVSLPSSSSASTLSSSAIASTGYHPQQQHQHQQFPPHTCGATSYTIDEYAGTPDAEEDVVVVPRSSGRGEHRRQVHYQVGDGKQQPQHFFYSSSSSQYRGEAPLSLSCSSSSNNNNNNNKSSPPPTLMSPNTATNISNASADSSEAGRDRDPVRSRSARSVVDNLTSTVLQFHQHQQQQQQQQQHQYHPHQYRIMSPNAAASLCQLEQIPSDSEADCSSLSVIDEFPADASGYYCSVPCQNRPSGGGIGVTSSNKNKYGSHSNSPGPLSPQLHQQHPYASGVSYASPPPASVSYCPSAQPQQQSARLQPGSLAYSPSAYSSQSSSRSGGGGDAPVLMSPNSPWAGHLGPGQSNYSRSRPGGAPTHHHHGGGGANSGPFRVPPDKYELPASPTSCMGSNSPVSNDRASPSLSLVGSSSAAAGLCAGHDDDASAPLFAAAAAAAAVAMVASQAPSSSNTPAEAVAAAMDAASVYTMASGLVRSCEAAAMSGMVAAAVNPRSLSTTTCFAKRLKLSPCGGGEDSSSALATSPTDASRQHSGLQHKTIGGLGKGGVQSLSHPAFCNSYSSSGSPTTASTSSTTMAAMRVAVATAAATAAGLVLFNRRQLASDEHHHHHHHHRQHQHRVSIAGSAQTAAARSSLRLASHDAIHVTVAEFTEGIHKAAGYIISERNSVALQKPSPNSALPCPPMHTLEHVEEVWSRMMQNFEVHSRFVVHFAKLLPGFNSIHLDDKRQLVRGAMYPLMLLKLSLDYVNKTNSKYNYFDFTEEEREVILKHFPTFHNITSHLIRSGEFLDRIRLDNIELALAGAQEVFKNRDGLSDPVPVDHLHNLAVRVLEDHIVASGHVVQDRLNAFKRLSPLLEELNIEHHRILAQLKQDMPQLIFPELYSEMFYLTEDEEREQRISVMQSAAVEAAAAALAETIQ